MILDEFRNIKIIIKGFNYIECYRVSNYLRYSGCFLKDGCIKYVWMGDRCFMNIFRVIKDIW